MSNDTRGIWEKRVEHWAKSGLTANQFAAKIGVNVHTLKYWKYRLSERSGQTSSKAGADRTAPSFIELVMPAQASVAAAEGPAVKPLEVVLRGDVVVRVPSDFDVALLRRVVDALGGR